MMFPTAVELYEPEGKPGAAVLVFTVGNKQRKVYLTNELAEVVREGLEFEDD